MKDMKFYETVVSQNIMLLKIKYYVSRKSILSEKRNPSNETV
jgi:hypothetical protein